MTLAFQALRTCTLSNRCRLETPIILANSRGFGENERHESAAGHFGRGTTHGESHVSIQAGNTWP